MQSIQTIVTQDAALTTTLVPGVKDRQGRMAAREIAVGAGKVAAAATGGPATNVSIDLSGDDWAYDKSNN